MPAARLASFPYTSMLLLMGLLTQGLLRVGTGGVEVVRADQVQSDDVPSEPVWQLFDQLASAEFAVRERAASQLTEMGVSIVPELRKLTEATTDPEVKLRAGGIIRQLTDGDAAGRIAAFLAGRTCRFRWLASHPGQSW